MGGAGQRFGLGLGFFGGPGTHFHQQEADAGRKLGEIVEREALAAHEIDQQMVKALEADGAMLEDARDGVGGQEGVGEAQHGEHAEGRAGGEVEGGGDDGGAGALRADQRAGDVEAVFGEQLVEVVAGDAAGNAGEFFADKLGVSVAQAGEAGVDFADTAAGADEGVELGGAGAADGHAGAVVEHEVEGFDVVDDLAGEQAVDAATVVADHAAEGAAGVGGGVGAIGEVVQLGGLAEAVEDDAGLDGGEFGGGVDGGEAVHVAGEIENHGHVGALAGERGACAAGEDSGSGGAAGGQCGFDVGGVAGIEDADGKLAVVGGVGGVEGAGTEVEEDVAAEGGLEQGFKLAVGGEALVVEGGEVGEDGKSAHGGRIARKGEGLRCPARLSGACCLFN